MAHQCVRVRVGDQHVTITIRFQLLQLNFWFLYTHSRTLCDTRGAHRCTIFTKTLTVVATIILLCSKRRRQIDRSVFGLLLCCGAGNVLCKFYSAQRIKANLQLRVMELAERFVFNLKRMYRLISNLLNAPFIPHTTVLLQNFEIKLWRWLIWFQ